MKKFTDFYEAWWYLHEHKVFMNMPLYEKDNSIMITAFSDLLCIDVVKVNSKTSQIDDDESLNTKTEVWLEIGPYWEETDEMMLRIGVPKWMGSHDPDLDCGGGTFEDAIIALANKVEEKYPIEKYGKLEL